MSDVIELQVAYQQILTDKPLAGESGGLNGRRNVDSLIRSERLWAVAGLGGKQDERKMKLYGYSRACSLILQVCRT